jgi:hypothetical protein
MLRAHRAFTQIRFLPLRLGPGVNGTPPVSHVKAGGGTDRPVLTGGELSGVMDTTGGFPVMRRTRPSRKWRRRPSIATTARCAGEWRRYTSSCTPFPATARLKEGMQGPRGQDGSAACEGRREEEGSEPVARRGMRPRRCSCRIRRRRAKSAPIPRLRLLRACAWEGVRRGEALGKKNRTEARQRRHNAPAELNDELARSVFFKVEKGGGKMDGGAA